MVYINENSKIVSFPKNSVESFDKIHFVNQVTKFSFDLFTTDLSDNKLIYTIDISPVIDKFEAGQYDYTFQKNDGTVICSGILQYEGFTPNVVAYNTKSDYIQYTPDETIYPEADTTITITENDTYNVEDYDTAIVNVKGGGNLQITNVYSSTYKITNAENEYGGYKQPNQLFADILINFNGDIKSIWNQKDLYITIAKYSKLNHKFNVLNDAQVIDNRLKMYCWVLKFNSENPIYWSYFYTTKPYNNSFEAYSDNPLIFATRQQNPLYRNEGAFGMYNNYATSLNQLVCNGTIIDDYWYHDEFERYEQGDLSNYFIEICSKNPIPKWGADEDGLTKEESYAEIHNNKDNFMLWLADKSCGKRGHREVPVGEDEYGNEIKEIVSLYAYRSYCGDYPIIPVKIADCEILMPVKLKEKYYGKDGGMMPDMYIPLKDITEEDFPLIDKVVLKLPYSTNTILGRLYTFANDNRNGGEFNFIYRDWNKGMFAENIEYSYNRISGGKNVEGLQADGAGCLEATIRIGLCTEEQVNSGNYKDLPQFTCKIYAKESGARTIDVYYDDNRNVVLPKIMYN